MSATTEIQWTDATWNPTTGCTKLSPGCAHCYIERTPAFRIAGRKFVRGATDLRLHADRLDTPRHWRKPRKVFVNSLSDLFHDDVPWSFIEQVFDTMQATPQHVYQVLTKRAENMRLFAEYWALHHDGPLPNVWLGVSVENQRFADERIPHLLKTPAAVRFLSCEPLLGPVSFRWAKWDDHAPHERRLTQSLHVHREGNTLAGQVNHLDGLRMLDWVIVGGESGPGARAFNVEWAREIVDQCRAANVPVFVKQLGANAYQSPEHDGATGYVLDLRDRKGGDMDEWPDDLRVRQFPVRALTRE